MLNALLFLDFGKTDRKERGFIETRLNTIVPTVLINFFTSDLAQLAIISKHRIVAVPTFLLLDAKNKVKSRIINIPDTEELAQIIHAVM